MAIFVNVLLLIFLQNIAFLPYRNGKGKIKTQTFQESQAFFFRSSVLRRHHTSQIRGFG